MSSFEISIDETLCKDCDLCVNDCPSLVFETVSGKVSVKNPDWCIKCGHCEAICPTKALRHHSMEAAGFEKMDRSLALTPDKFLHFLRSRRSLRQYINREVPPEIIGKIIEAGRYAPTGTNSQNVEWIVLTDRDQIENLQKITVRFFARVFNLIKNPLIAPIVSLTAGKENAKYLKDSVPKILKAKELMDAGNDRLFYSAPALLVVHAPAWDTSSPFNCVAAIYSAALMAETLGLGSCFNGFLLNAILRNNAIRKSLKIPKKNRAYATMTIGYPKFRYQRLVPRNTAKVSWNP